MNTIIPLITSIVLLSFIFFLSRTIVQDLFAFLHKILKKPPLVFRAVALLFLPGTFIHEAAHYIAAKLLFLKVVGFSLWPQWKHNSVRLGSVTYIRRDPFRGILVGIAPVLLGILLLERVVSLIPFPTQFNGYALFYGLLLFLVSTTMFSSKQDLIDIIRILPFFCIAVILIYLFDLDFMQIAVPLKSFIGSLSPYLDRLNSALGIVLGIQAGSFLLIKCLRFLVR